LNFMIGDGVMVVPPRQWVVMTALKKTHHP